VEKKGNENSGLRAVRWGKIRKGKRKGKQSFNSEGWKGKGGERINGAVFLGEETQVCQIEKGESPGVGGGKKVQLPRKRSERPERSRWKGRAKKEKGTVAIG